jgi:hypothetical protein
MKAFSVQRRLFFESLLPLKHEGTKIHEKGSFNKMKCFRVAFVF